MSDRKRTRFDAIAEEMFDQDPPKKPPRKVDNPPTEAIRRAFNRKPEAWLSTMGVMYPVIDWQMNSSMNYDREAEFFGMAFREPTHTVELKLVGRVPNLMRPDTTDAFFNADAVLVIQQKPEPLYFRLAIRDVTWTMTGQGEGYTTVQANCTQVE